MANTIDDLKEQALTIKNASQTGENTANRVGTLFYDIVDNLVVGKYEFRYKNSKVKPTKPADGSDGTTGGWAKEPTDPIYTEGELTWMTQCYYSYVNGYGKWSTPIRITGANGKDGEDGKDVEFIYTRNDTGKTLKAPIYDARGNEIATQDDWYGTDSLGVSWTDNPQGVEEDVRYEYICVRTKEAGAARWGAFSEPVIWSKWGEKGKDGDGYEYIFINTSDESITPNINYDTWFDPRTQTYKTKNDDEYLPYSSNGTYTTRWNDDPIGVSITNKIEWVSVRKKINGTWGDFSDPKVWSRYAEDGAAGGRYEIRYKNYIPTEEAPVPAKPTEDGRSDGWTDNPVDPDIERGEYTFLSQAYYNEGKDESTGTYGEWSDPIRITGPQGEQGEDGADIEFIYTRINDLINAPAAPIYDADHNPINTQDDWKGTDDAGVVWTDNPQGIDPDDHRYEFVSMRSKIVSQSIWGPFCTPVVWSNWGDKGMDGDGIQYIFKLFDHELDDDERVSNVPTNATLNSKGEWMPSGTSGVNAGWHDDPVSPTESVPFCYCSTIKKIGGEWNKEGDYGKFEPLGYWTKWSADGSNAVRVDLDNEMDSILYDGTGTQKMSGNVSTKAYVYDGITDVSDQAAFSISSREGMSEEQAVISGRTITVNGLTSDGIVTVRAEYPKNSGKYYFSTFTVKKLVGVDKYELVVIPNALSVNSSETVTDRTISVQVYRTPANGGAREVINVNSYGLTLTATASNGVVLEGQGATTITYNLPGTLADSVDYVTVLLTKVTVVQDVETIPVTHVKNGKDGSGANAVKIDLDNEMDAIPCDVDGYVMAETNLQTGARIYDGANPVVLTEGNTEVTIEKIAGVAASYTFNDGVINISWVIRTSITPLAQDKYTAKVTLKWHDNYYYGTFTASVVRSGEPGVSPIIYQLAPNPNTIAFKRDSSGNLPTSPVTLKMLVKKNDADGTHYININQSGLTVRYSFTDMPDDPGDGDPFTDSGISVSKEKNNVYVAAFSGNYLMDRETVPIVVDGENGTSPWIADLDNEMDSVACNLEKHPTGTAKIGTVLSMFYGSNKKQFKISSVTRNGSTSYGPGVSVSYSSAAALSHTLQVTYSTAATINGKDDFAITLTPTEATSETRILHLTINGVLPGPDGKPASIYRLVPSCSEIVKKKDDSTVPSGNVTCSVIKVTGDSDPEKVTGGFTLNTYVNNDPTPYGSDSVPASIVTSNIRYELIVGSVVVDKETIPVVADGKDSNVPGSQGPQGICVEKQYQLHTTYERRPDPHSGWTTTQPAPDVNKPYLWERTRTYNPKTEVYSDWVYACLTGIPGSTGATGKMYYPAGEWSSSVTYTMTEKACPLVYYNGEWYYLIKDPAKGSSQSPTNAQYWEKAANYQVIIADAIFTNFAKFGSAVITGDWLISTKETSESPSNNYKKFDSDYPNSPNEQRDNFIPMLAMDLSSGTTYQHDGYFDGTITSTAGSIGGFEIADNSIGEDRSSSEDENFTIIYNDGTAFFCNYTAQNNSFEVHGNAEIAGNSVTLDGNVFLIARNAQKVYIDGQLNMDSDFSNVNAGDVYRDDFGSLFVRKEDRNANYNQINFKTSGTNLLLPSDVPPATVYFAKLEGNGIVSSHTPIMNSHNRELWSRDEYANIYVENIYQESHFFVFDGTYWIDYHCSAQ